MTDETTQALLPVKVTQADRDLIVTLMRPLAKNAIEHKAIDFIAEGRGDDAEAVQLVAKYRLAHSPPSQADAGKRDEFLTAYVSGDLKVIGIEHDTDADWQLVHDAHIALRDRINERLAERDKCPHKPATLSPPTSGEEMRLREALEAITFLTCVSGDGPTPYLKVHFNDLAAAHAGHDALLAVKRGKS